MTFTTTTTFPTLLKHIGIRHIHVFFFFFFYRCLCIRGHQILLIFFFYYGQCGWQLGH